MENLIFITLSYSNKMRGGAHELQNFSICASMFFHHAGYCQINFPYSSRRSGPLIKAFPRRHAALGRTCSVYRGGGKGVEICLTSCTYGGTLICEGNMAF